MGRLSINDDDIAEAELAILGEGSHFNDSQIEFIKCLDTTDLVACPGSGKTTALVAKLYILAKYEVWSKGDPICVISHTRIAVDEIKDKVASHFPKIMDYPNFVGTIQQFTDRYLAIPYYKSLNLSDIKSIDDDIFLNKWQTQNTWTLRNFLMNGGGCQTEDDYRKKIAGIKYFYNRTEKIKPSDISLANATSTSYQQALVAKQTLFEAGYLTYADTRLLANEYLEAFPNITHILKERFSYIFLDEAQDTSLEQMHLLEQFAESNCYQRIGDPLQTIFNADSENTDVWQIRAAPQRMELSISNRFGNKIATMVNHIGTSLAAVNGLNTSITDDVYQKCIALLFEDDNPTSVMEWYENYVDQELNFLQTKSVYAIGAAGKYKEDRLTISSYYPAYKNDRRAKSDYFRSASEYFRDIDRKSVMKMGSNLIYSRLSKLFISEIKDIKPELSSQEIKDKLFQESPEISKLVIDIMKAVNAGLPIPFDAISERLKIEAKHLYDIDNFSISFSVTDDEDQDEEPLTGKIRVSTIHGVKGQTHDATLLLTTQFHNTGASKKANEIGGTDLDYLVHTSSSDRNIRRRRLLYVSSSRPRYIFVWAIPKSKQNKFSQIETLFSEIIEL